MIDLSRILSHLPYNKVKELETVTQRIVETGMASMVILYGSYARGDWKEISGGRSGKKSDYDILILTKDERDRRDLQNKLFKMFDNQPTAVQPLVETLSFVNMHLREKQYFFTEIKQQGIVLYAETHVKLAEPENLTPTRIRELAEQDLKYWFGMAQANFETYQLVRQKFEDTKEHRFASKGAFELQQCIEQCYTCIEMVFSRTNPHEHRLFILRMNAKRYVSEIDQCFPQTTAEEKDLFLHLDAAYIGGRYIDEEHYHVTREQLDYWEKEAKKLLELTEKACQKKISALKEKERKS